MNTETKWKCGSCGGSKRVGTFIRVCANNDCSSHSIKLPETQPTHTQVPCRAEHTSPCDMFCDGCMADCWEVNKPFIVRAVNAHEDLLEALKIALFHFQGESAKGNFVDVPAGFNHDISMEGLLSKAIHRAEKGE